jgi:hypothetical protein
MCNVYEIYSRVRASDWANAKVATLLGSIPASTDTVESEGRQEKQSGIKYLKIPRIPQKKSMPSLAACSLFISLYCVVKSSVFVFQSY